VKILITNDDGYDTPGINLLEKAVRTVFGDASVYVYSPLGNCSATGRSMTSSHKVSRIGFGNSHYAVDGLPVDCVIMGCQLHDFGKDDLVISGINNGWNVGRAYFYMSGTAQAAQYAWDAFDVPGIALSCYENTIDEYTSRVYDALRLIKKQGHHSGLININFPNGSSKGEKITKLGLFRHRGTLEPDFSVGGETGSLSWYNLFEFSSIEVSEGNLDTDAGAVMAGYTSFTLMQGAKLSL
jgi:5'-nucleotidase